MLITINNANLRLCIDTLGAQMMGLQSADGIEYLWQGDPRYWSDRAINLFPFVGRLTNDGYRLNGQEYPMGIHGFAYRTDFTAIRHTQDQLVLELTDDSNTQTQYPFSFSFRVSYALKEDTVAVTYTVQNLSDKTMPFGIGGHPGFNVPLVSGECFEDYILEFSQVCQPDRVGFSPAVYLSGRDELYPLEDGKRIHLCHDLFDEDAVILKNMDRQVTLLSGVSGRGVCVTFPELPYLGIWHCPKTDAPYVCIEPWSSLPSRQGVTEELSCKSDLIHLAPGKTYEVTWTIRVF